MFVRRVKKTNEIISIRICETSWDKGKVLQKTLKVVGQSKNHDELMILERTAKEMILLMQKNNPLYADARKKKKSSYKEVPDSVTLNDTQVVKKVNDGIFNIFGTVYDSIGLNKLITGTYKDRQWNDILKSLVLARLASPRSKRKTASVLSRDYLINHSLEKYYRTMDRAIKFTDESQKIVLEETRRICGGDITIVLFDVTTLYFESVENDELRDFGYSKDCKFGEVQVVLSLMTTKEGYPVGYKLFPGNTAEGKTLLQHIEEAKFKFNLKKVTLIADRAMFSKENLKSMDDLGINYIVACKLRTLSKKMKDKITGDDDFAPNTVCEELHWIKEYEYEGRRLIVSYASKRAGKDESSRKKLTERILKKSKEGKVKAGDMIGNKGSKRFLKLQGEKPEIDEEKILREKRWDGLHGVITNNVRLAATTVLGRYRDLGKIEEAFRFNKHDLKMRPVYHWKKERIEGHILVCYLAFAVSRFTMQRMAEGFKKNLGKVKTPSFAVCIEELSRVESRILRNKNSKDKSLYVSPDPLGKEAWEIYSAMEIERRDTPFCL